MGNYIDIITYCVIIELTKSDNYAFLSKEI